MPMRPNSLSLRDLTPTDPDEPTIRISKRRFNLSDEGNQAQLRSVLSGIVAGEYQDEDIQGFTELYPETAPFVSQAIRQREIFRSNFQQPKAPVYEPNEEMSSPGAPGKADLGGAMQQLLGMGDVEGAKKLADLAATIGRGGDKQEGPVLKAVPADTVTKVTSGLNALNLMKDIIPALTKISGRVGGNIERVKVWANAGDQDVTNAQSAIEQFDFLAQAFQKGAASEPDIKRAMDIRPAFGLPEAHNRKRAENFSNLFSAIIKSEISNYKGKGYEIPEEWGQLADNIGIDINKIQPYSSGKNNPYTTMARNIARKNLSESLSRHRPDRPGKNEKPEFKNMSNEDLLKKALGQ